MTADGTALAQHLPECDYGADADHGSPWCICDRIRAAERRTVVRILEAVGPTMALQIAVKITEGDS